jgi:hypothetical protein
VQTRNIDITVGAHPSYAPAAQLPGGIRSLYLTQTYLEKDIASAARVCNEKTKLIVFTMMVVVDCFGFVHEWYLLAVNCGCRLARMCVRMCVN